MRATSRWAALPVGALLVGVATSGCALPTDEEAEPAGADAPEPTGEAAFAMRPPEDYTGPPIGGIAGRGWHRDRPHGGFGRQPVGPTGPRRCPGAGGERLFEGHRDWRGHHWTGDRFEPPFAPGALVGPEQGARACTTATDGTRTAACTQCVAEGGSWHVADRVCL